MLLVLPLVFYFSNAKNAADHNVFDKVVVTLSAPIQWVVVHTLDGVSNTWHSYVALVDLQADNDTLRAEVNTLRAEMAKREEQRIENERLRLLLGVRDQMAGTKLVYANVVASSPSPLYRSLRIDRGESDGITMGAAVLSARGVVGRVAALAAGYADVMLLVDSNSSTDVFVQRTRARARVRGAGGDRDARLTVEYLARTAQVEPGDIVITSGAGTIFPKGFVVGTVIGVERGAFGLYQHAEVEPSVDFARVEDVMVVTSPVIPDTTEDVVVPPADSVADRPFVLAEPPGAVSP